MDLFDRLKASAPQAWHSYVDHAFVRQMGDGTLSEAAFRAYLVQDYLFLIQFARAYGLAAYKSRSFEDICAAQDGLAAILKETELHVRLCARWGLSRADIAAAHEHQATVAYTRFVLDCGAAGDLLDLHVALAPCVVDGPRPRALTLRPPSRIPCRGMKREAGHEAVRDGNARRMGAPMRQELRQNMSVRTFGAASVRRGNGLEHLDSPQR